MATKTITLRKARYTTLNGTGLKLSAETVVEVDGNGKYVPNSATTTLFNNVGSEKLNVGTLKAGSPWTFTENTGADLRRTLAKSDSQLNSNLRINLAHEMVPKGALNPEGLINSNSTALEALGGPSVPQGDDPDPLEFPEAADAAPNINLTGAVSANIPTADRVRRKYPVLFYPLDLASNKQDTIKFSMKENQGSTITSGIGIDNVKRNDSKPIEGSVTLPIPAGIQDTNTVDFNEGQLNPFQAFVVAGSLNLMNSETADLGQNIGRIFGQASSALRNNEQYSTALKTYLAQEATSTQGLLSRTTGAILNPNLELLFNKPNLRDFSFIFRMSPRDGKEASSVKQIIRFFKQGMCVKPTADGTFLKSPFVFDINYLAYTNVGGERVSHKSIGKIKTCALMSCTTNYTPDGSYMTFTDNDRTMTSYELSLQFKELDPLTEDDYLKEADLTEVGF